MLLESDVFPVTYLNVSKDLDLQRLLVEWDVVKSAHDANLAMSFEIQVRRTDEATTVWTVCVLRKEVFWSFTMMEDIVMSLCKVPVLVVFLTSKPATFSEEEITQIITLGLFWVFFCLWLLYGNSF